MTIVALVLFFFYVNDGQGHGSDMAVFDIDQGSFGLVWENPPRPAIGSVHLPALDPAVQFPETPS
jgi:hypothetical protein